MSAQHTPGEWRILWGRKGSYPLAIHNGAVNIVTAMGRKAHPEAIANARLIAAAPELLNALRAACSTIELEYGSDSCPSFRALIAKATGAAS